MRPSYVNRVWAVAESAQAEVGSLRVFLSEGTLVMASRNATPAFGRWSEANGRLTITEEGIDYATDILELTPDRFRIRMHSPGDPVDILFESAPATASLTGTAWRLEDLAGAGVLDRVEATLEFPVGGRASGNGSCNGFSGPVTVEGGRIRFGAIVATRRACPEAVMNQESAYFAALEKAERFESDGTNLYLYVAENPKPLRFIRAEQAAP